jgi:hypothetical protein
MRALLNAPARAAFVRTVRRIAGRDDTSPFSVDDVHRVARALGLNGILFLEKAGETRHATVLLGLDETLVGLYDPWAGIKVKRCDATQLGMFCRLVGAVGDEFRDHERAAALTTCPDVWDRYARRGVLLRQFLRHHRELQGLLCDDVARRLEPLELPPTQHELRPADCAPLSLYVIALLRPGSATRTARHAAAVGDRPGRGAAVAAVGPLHP